MHDVCGSEPGLAIGMPYVGAGITNMRDNEYDDIELVDLAKKGSKQAFEHLDQFQGESDFSIWLSRIVVNQCLMFMRSRRRVRFLHLDAGIRGYLNGSIDLPSWRLDPEGEVGKRQVGEVLAREIRRIPALLRNVVLLR